MAGQREPGFSLPEELVLCHERCQAAQALAAATTDADQQGIAVWLPAKQSEWRGGGRALWRCVRRRPQRDKQCRR